MDSDSLLEILAPGFYDFDLAWEPANVASCTMQAPAFGWLSDGFMNTEGFISDGTDEEEEKVYLELTPGLKSSSSCKRPASTTNGTMLSNASETYISVLKLSDIASALYSFSRATSSPTAHCGTPRTPLQKSSERSAASVPPSPSVQGSGFLMHSIPSMGRAASTTMPVDTLRTQVVSVGAIPVSRAKEATTDDSQKGQKASKLASSPATESTDNLLELEMVSHSAIAKDVFDGKIMRPGGDNERESGSRLIIDGDDEWDSADDECDEEDGGRSTIFEDYSPRASHVRIIRRPNSNCGQALAPSPKRVKSAHLKAKETSSSETANVQDDKEGASNMSSMRKEGMSQREVHIMSERHRRKSMRESFSVLQSLIPKLKLKHADRITVLTEVITYIQSLNGTLEELERKKADMMDLLGFSSKVSSHGPQAELQSSVTYVITKDNSSSDEKNGNMSGGWCNNLQNGERVAMVEVTVRMCGSDVFVTLSTPPCRGVWSGVLLLLQKYSVEVSNSTVATSGGSSFHCIHAKATNLSRIEGVDLQEKIEDVIIKVFRGPSRNGQH